MNEEKLCAFIKENQFKKTMNTWHTFIINTPMNRKIIEILIPSKGNVKIRKPINKTIDGEYDYQVYRITKNNTLYDMGVFRDVRPLDSEVYTYDFNSRLEN